jgi:hypothetical protein
MTQTWETPVLITTNLNDTHLNVGTVADGGTSTLVS